MRKIRRRESRSGGKRRHENESDEPVSACAIPRVGLTQKKDARLTFSPVLVVDPGGLGSSAEGVHSGDNVRHGVKGSKPRIEHLFSGMPPIATASEPTKHS